MAEEFQESDVFWPEKSRRREDRLYHSVFQDENINPTDMDINNNNYAAAQQKTKKKNSKQRNTSHSLPVTIPCNLNNSSLHYSESNESDDDELEEAEMVPPHLMVAGRCTGQGQMAYSVCTGNGRTLKGRDLSRVRNSILRMTGFIET
ncbi:uncharacterized protein LOC122064202 [Macadamia integrifolia]|uniref:uncharacterized protein LOC122064202 n=1 Tax=Macadamia integrifolia TaxID=60698 RepID=UPI001C4ED2AE|nr:uncharacterized protein LOC122064202 [Macadamia integrifolia]